MNGRIPEKPVQSFGMEQFRVQYAPIEGVDPELLWVEVIGYHMHLRGMYEAPAGVPAWRLMLFHAPMKIRCGTEELVLPGHAFCIFPPGLTTTYGLPDGEWAHSWIRLSGRRVPALLAEYGLESGWVARFAGTEDSDTWLLNLHRELHAARGPDFRIVEHILGAWLGVVDRTRRRQTSDIAPALLRVRQHIEMRYAEHLCLRDLAAMADLSEAHFCDCFRRAFGRPPLAYATALRLAHAVELLTNTCLPIAEVGRMCGYQDPYYFSRRFRVSYGCSPRCFRQGRQGCATGAKGEGRLSRESRVPGGAQSAPTDGTGLPRCGGRGGRRVLPSHGAGGGAS